MKLDCGHDKETGFMTSRGLLCFMCAVRPSLGPRRHRRSHDEVVEDRDAKRRAIIVRREFNNRKRAEREARRRKS